VCNRRMSSMLPLQLECLPRMPRISDATCIAQPALMSTWGRRGLDVHARVRGGP
jgi:hypothetical protein